MASSQQKSATAFAPNSISSLRRFSRNMVTDNHPHHPQHMQQRGRYLQQTSVHHQGDDRAMVMQQQHAPSVLSGEPQQRINPGSVNQHGVHHGNASSQMEERAAALQAAAAVAAAVTGFGSSNNLPVGMDLSGLVPVGLMSHLQHHDQQQNGSNNSSNQQRKQREFIPDNKKDDSYWDRRRRNNEAAKRSREKRRLNDMVLESRVLELTKENHILRAQLAAVRDKYGINPDALISIDQVLATLPSPDQVLSLPRPRSRLLSGLSPSMGRGGGSVSPAPSNRSMSPPMQQQQHSHPPPQQQRQSVLMSMNRSHRSPSPPAGQHHAYSNGQHHGYRYQTGGESASHSFQQHQPAMKTQQQRIERPLPPLPALTPVPVISPSNHHMAMDERAPQDGSLHMGGVVDRAAGNGGQPAAYFDLCSSSSSSSSSSSHPGSSSGDDGSHSPIDPAVAAGRLPHKLRHKTHLGDRDVAAATASAAAALLTLNDIKHEPEGLDDSPSAADSIVEHSSAEMNNNVIADHLAHGHHHGHLHHHHHHHPQQQQQQQQQLHHHNSGRRSTESSDERDSGISSGGDWSLPRSSSRFSTSSGGSASNGNINAAHPGYHQPATKRMRMSPNSTSVHQQMQQQQQQQQRRFAVRINHQHQMTNSQETEEQEVDSLSIQCHGVTGGNESSDENNDELRSHIARLASELESLKTLIGAGAASSSAGSGSAMRIKNNNSANFRLH